MYIRIHSSEPNPSSRRGSWVQIRIPWTPLTTSRMAHELRAPAIVPTHYKRARIPRHPPKPRIRHLRAPKDQQGLARVPSIRTTVVVRPERTLAPSRAAPSRQVATGNATVYGASARPTADRTGAADSRGLRRRGLKRGSTLSGGQPLVTPVPVPIQSMIEFQVAENLSLS